MGTYRRLRQKFMPEQKDETVKQRQNEAEKGPFKAQSRLEYLSFRNRFIAYIKQNPTVMSTDDGFPISKKQRKELENYVQIQVGISGSHFLKSCFVKENSAVVKLIIFIV